MAQLSHRFEIELDVDILHVYGFFPCDGWDINYEEEYDDYHEFIDEYQSLIKAQEMIWELIACRNNKQKFEGLEAIVVRDEMKDPLECEDGFEFKKIGMHVCCPRRVVVRNQWSAELNLPEFEMELNPGEVFGEIEDLITNDMVNGDAPLPLDKILDNQEVLKSEFCLVHAELWSKSLYFKNKDFREFNSKKPGLIATDGEFVYGESRDNHDNRFEEADCGTDGADFSVIQETIIN